MRKSPNIRMVNGIVSAVIVVVFFLHAALGSRPAVSGFAHRFAPLIWVGVALVVVHVVLCVATSAQQLTDKVRPPSRAKKRHLLLKWVTGGLLAVAAGAHAACVHAFGMGSVHATATGVALAAGVLALLAWHTCVGAKSLLKDLNIDRRHRTPLRIAACVVAVAIGAALLIGALPL